VTSTPISILFSKLMLQNCSQDESRNDDKG
jgi:hypothetical protein